MVFFIFFLLEYFPVLISTDITILALVGLILRVFNKDRYAERNQICDNLKLISSEYNWFQISLLRKFT